MCIRDSASRGRFSLDSEADLVVILLCGAVYAFRGGRRPLGRLAATCSTIAGVMWFLAYCALKLGTACVG
eukprot:3270002-Alexandrium_andersonii.AAC.1